jgi:hypothetical protein
MCHEFLRCYISFYRSKVETIQRPSKRVNRNSLLYRISIYRHPRYIPTNFGRQTVALYRDRAVPVFIMTDALGSRFTLVCLLSHSNMCTDRHSTATFAFGVMSWRLSRSSGPVRCKTAVSYAKEGSSPSVNLDLQSANPQTMHSVSIH